MAFKEVQDLDCSTTISLGGRDKKSGKPNPLQIEGYYIGSKNTPSRKSKTGYSKLHILQTKTGNIGVWGKTDLDRKMLAVSAGVMVRVTQKGTVPTPNGDMYKFLVEVDSDNTIEVNLPVEQEETSSTQSEEGYGSTASEDSLEEEEETTSYHQDPIPTSYKTTKVGNGAVAGDPARQARVQALLNKGRTS